MLNRVAIIICLLISVNAYGLVENFDKITEISNEVVKDCKNDTEKVLTISHFVFLELKPDASKGIPANARMSVVDRLESGVGWCNHQVGVFMALSYAQGIRTRMLYLLNREGTASPHTIGEAFIDGKWYIIDPQQDFNVLITRYDAMKDQTVLKGLLENRRKTVYPNDPKAFDEFVELYYNPSMIVQELP